MNLSETERTKLERAKADLKNQTVLFPAISGFLFVLIGFSVYFYHIIEKWNVLDSIYFTVVTMATVGYGDFTPKTNVGKVYTMLLIILGIATFTAFITQLAKRQSLKRVQKELEGKRVFLNKK